MSTDFSERLLVNEILMLMMEQSNQLFNRIIEPSSTTIAARTRNLRE